MTDKTKITTATGFMHSQHPAENWVMTAIPVGEGNTITRTFQHDAGLIGTGRHVTDLQNWIDDQQPNHNVYWQPNPTIDDMTTKAGLKHTKAMARLQVDVDPEPGANLIEEQERILALFTHKLPKGIPEPTTLVFSGGGYQAFWDLEEPFRIDGDEAKAHEAGLYNKLMAEIFEGDNCHAVCNLYRAAFTLNVAGEAKIKKGRTDTQSSVMFHKLENIYPLGRFKKSKNTDEAVRDAVDFSREVTPTIEEIIALGGSSDLPAAITYKPKYLRDREEPPIDLARWPSRSERVLFVACELVRLKLPDDKIVGTLLNKDWGVSDSMYTFASGKQRRKPTEYAINQVGKAKAKIRQSKDNDDAANSGVKGKLKFKCDNEGKPFKTLFHNYRVAVQELGVTVQKDQFSTCYMISGLDDFDGRMTDEAVTRLRLKIEDKFGFKIPKDAMRDLIGDIGEYNRVHPVCDYLNGVNWDGINRLDSWMPRYLGTPQNDYTKAVGQLILTAAVRRVRKPGCKFDEMVILEGDQGSGKSTALRILAVSDKWFADELPLGGDGKQVMEAIEGKWIIEAAELAGIGKRSAEHLKAMLSRTFDKGRKAYGHFSDQQERQCVFFASHNPEKGNNTYLSDPTGNRRFWPVECGKVDLKALKEDRDQLWAEAAMREARGDSIRLDPSLYHLAAGEQSKREQENPMEAKFEAKMGGKTGRIAIGEMYELLGVSPQNHQQVTLMGRAAKALRWQKSPLTYDGVKQKCYWKGDQVEKLTELVPFRGKDGVWRVADREQANQANMIPDRW